MSLITSRFRRFRDWYRGSLANAFAASSALIAVTSSLVVALISLVVIHYVESRALQSDLEARSVRVADALVSTLKVVDDATNALAMSSIFMMALLDSNGRSAYVTPFIEGYRFPIDADSAMALCDINGNVLASTRNRSVRCERNSPAFQRALQSPLPQRELIQDHDGRSIRRLLLGVVFSYTGSVEGVVVAEVELASLMQHVAKESSVWSMELKASNLPAEGVRIRPQTDSGDITHVVQRRIVDGEDGGSRIDLELLVADRLTVWRGKLIPLLVSYGTVVLILVFSSFD